jgi:adenylate cyclase
MRTIVDIPEDQLKRLTRICEREHVSRAEVVRRAIAVYLRQGDAASEDQAFGLWRDRGLEGLSYQNALRDEWSGSE